jgi:hypothetical protein
VGSGGAPICACMHARTYVMCVYSTMRTGLSARTPQPPCADACACARQAKRLREAAEAQVDEWREGRWRDFLWRFEKLQGLRHWQWGPGSGSGRSRAGGREPRLGGEDPTTSGT